MLDAFEAPPEVFAGIAVLAFLAGFGWMKLFEAANPRWRRPASWAILTAMLFQMLLAVNGVLRLWDRRPPPFLAMMACIFAAIIYLSRRFGPALAGLSFGSLILLQAFRLPLELVMHRAATAGIMPVAMSYSGWNFDIVTGATAGVVAYLAWTGAAPVWLLWVWNLLGSVTLLVVVGIAIAALPIAHAFGYDQMNTWVTYPPFVWLPGVLVPAAMLGHLVIWRKLLNGRTS
jgi:hypothetical protein